MIPYSLWFPVNKLVSKWPDAFRLSVGPVCLFGDLCTKRMNVHLVLHLHNISGNMSPSTQLTP
jgi:hypothetical protein